MKSLKIHTEHGFTLLETILAVLVIGIMALLAVPRILDTDRRAAYTTAHQIVADMRLARTNAITKAEKYKVSFQELGTRYVGYKILKVSDETEIKSMTIPDQLTFEPDGDGGGWPPDLIFTPLGNIENALGGEIIAHITGGGHQVNIEATIATGRVSVQ